MEGVLSPQESRERGVGAGCRHPAAEPRSSGQRRPPAAGTLCVLNATSSIQGGYRSSNCGLYLLV